MTAVARIRRHPTDRECVLVHTPPDMADALGRFGPARYTPDHFAYVVHHSHIDALFRFARTVDLHLVDERNTQHHAVRTLPVECRHCGQAGSLGNPPAICPACGETWTPNPPPVRDDPITKTPCEKCGHKQPGRFPYCARCGNPMTYKASPPPVSLPRPKLADPMPLSQAVTEAVQQTFQQDAHRARGPVPPYLPPRDPDSRRPIEDVPLPNGEEYDPTTEPDWPSREPEPAQGEPDPRAVERQHRINAATAAIRHEPVPDRDVARHQVETGQTTQPPTRERMGCCGRWPSQPHTEDCPTRDTTPATTPTDEPVEEELPYDRWGSW